MGHSSFIVEHSSFVIHSSPLFRALLAGVAGLLLTLVAAPWLLGWLRRHFPEPNTSDSPRLRELHREKQATPTLGGLLIVAGLVAGLVVFADLGNPFLQAAVLVAVGLAVLGMLDDLTKLRGTRNGISARSKLLGQTAVASLAAVMIYRQHIAADADLELNLPLIGTSLALGAWFLPLAVIVIVGFSNAVNLTDGLDGLATGCLTFAVAAMAVVAYVAGHAETADYWGVPFVSGASEMTVLAGAVIGGLLGFLRFNCHPARVFMGDTGSLPLGGLLGLMALVARQELLLLVIGGVFVAEAGSVILQVGYYKWRRRRIFLCAPLHHHFQFLGWPETKIVFRFWMASATCALLGLISLNARIWDDSSPRQDSITAQRRIETKTPEGTISPEVDCPESMARVQ